MNFFNFHSLALSGQNASRGEISITFLFLPVPARWNPPNIWATIFGVADSSLEIDWLADHGRLDWLGCWDEFVQKARFKKLVCLHHIKQNNLTYLGQVCTPCLSVSTCIYNWLDCSSLTPTTYLVQLDPWYTFGMV